MVSKTDKNGYSSLEPDASRGDAAKHLEFGTLRPHAPSHAFQVRDYMSLVIAVLAAHP